MHLSDVFLELFTYVRYLTDSPEMADAEYEAVRADMDALIGRLEGRARRAKASAEQFDMARFAVFAWVDEAVLCSTWTGTRQWLKRPLQREYYDTANAGEEFFERLDGLLGSAEGTGDQSLLADFAREVDQDKTPDAKAAEVLEVYALCLGLGFTGMHFSDAGRDALERLRTDCVARIVGRQGRAGLSAFPEAYGSGPPKGDQSGYWRVFDPLSIVFAALPILVVAGVYLAYRGLLEHGLNLWFG